ncbi:hypothetical protein CYY_007466 [Polysphondylium violaceum]|uniref:Secreted protein n=1 Tax=Polysphondylium violaceum TaxID=133409 RepID=A0A8J4PPL9_9MYCE|nr:hypothetical protein CYY_007466 [Polysphondylium violaceum]
MKIFLFFFFILLIFWAKNGLCTYIPTEETLNTINELLISTRTVGNETVFIPIGFSFTDESEVENAFEFLPGTWLALEKELIYVDDTGPIFYRTLKKFSMVQVQEIIFMDELDKEEKDKFHDVTDGFEEDDPATDPLAIIIESYNSFTAAKKFNEYYMYTLFFPPVASLQMLIDQSEGTPIDGGRYRKYKQPVDGKKVSVVKKDIEKYDEGFPNCETIHFFYTLQGDRDKQHYNALLLIKDSDDDITSSLSNKLQRLEAVRYRMLTYYSARESPISPGEGQEGPDNSPTKDVEIPSYQDKVIQCFLDSDTLFYSSTRYQIKLRAIIILERILFPLFDMVCEEDWREDCWDTATSLLTETSVINMAEKGFLMDCISGIVEDDEEMQEKLYGSGQYKNIYENQKYKFSAPIAPLTRNRDVIVETDSSIKVRDYDKPENQITLGMFYDLFLKRSNHGWCTGKQNTLLCMGRINPEKVKDSKRKEINGLIKKIRNDILRYEKSTYTKRSLRGK